MFLLLHCALLLARAVDGQVAPTITSSPTNQTLTAGLSVTLRATASGSAPLKYQWQLNGTNLEAATGPTLTFTAVRTADSGAYRVVVTNSYGSATSAPGVLTVLPVVVWGDSRGGVLNVPAAASNAVKIAVGGKFCLALKSDGKVVAWGDNTYGQTNLPPTATNVVAIAAGSSHGLAAREDGFVIAWGRNDSGQTNVPASATNVIAVAAGSGHSLALRRDGSVIAWGSGAGITNVPASAINVVAIAAGSSHSLALRGDGVVSAWGLNNYGQLNVAGYGNVVGLAAGDFHSLILRTDGKVLATGDNYYRAVSVPFNLDNVVSIAAGSTHSIALKNDGTLVGWGEKPPILGYVPFGLTNAPSGISNIVEVAGGDLNNIARVSDGSPQFIGPPTTVVGWLGGQVLLNGSAVGKQPLNFQWLFNSAPIPGATQAFLGLTNLQSANAGQYSVVVTGPSGAVTNAAATLLVSPPPLPAIASGPSDVTALAGTNVMFTVATVSGVPAGFQWQFNWNNLPGRTNSTLTLTNVQNTEAGAYQLVLTNVSGSVTSSPVSLTVLPSPPRIVAQPQSLTTTPGLTAGFSVQAVGSAPLAFQWQFNEVDLLGCTSPSLVFPSVQSSDAGNYQVIITNVLGAITSSVVTLTTVPALAWGRTNSGLGAVPAAANNAIALAAGGGHLLALGSDGTVTAWGENSYGQAIVPPEATNVTAIAAGDGHSMALHADGSVVAWGNNASGQINAPAGATNLVAIAAGGSHSLALRYDGTVIGWGDNSYGQTNVPPDLSGVLAIAAGRSHCLAATAEGRVIAWGWGFWGQTNVPAAATNVTAIAACDHNSLALRADGTPIAWGTFRPNTDYATNATGLTAIAVGNYHSLAIRADGTVVSWGYDFSGETKVPSGLTNVAAVAGGYLFSAALSFSGPARFGVPPFNRVALAGEQQVFKVAVSGPPSRYQWLADGVGLVGATNLTLFLSNVQSSTTLRLAAWNSFGGATSAPIALTVQPAAPWLTYQPPANQVVAPGATASVRIGAAGSEPLTYQWRFDGTNLLDGPRIGGATSPILSLMDFGDAEAGDYFVRISNAHGSFTVLVATLTVATAPLIAQSPGSQSVSAGSNATFLVSADGNGPFSYQWRLNATNLANRTNATLTVTNAQFVNAGDYDVIVSNPYGAATSVVATLTVTPAAPGLTLQPVSRTVTAGNATTFIVRALGSEPLRYQWRWNGLALAGATSTNLSLPNVQTSNAGQYSVIVTNDFGSATSSNAVLTVTETAPVISTNPQSLVAIRGMNATLTVAAKGTEPLGYQWQRNQLNLSGATGASLTLTNVQVADDGLYRVVVGNPRGTLVSGEAALKVVSVVAWGQGSSGQTNVPLNAVDIAAVACGAFHSLAVGSDGSVLAWGTYSPPTPAYVPVGLGDVVAVAGGFQHSLALQGDGTVAAWGYGPHAVVPTGLGHVRGIAAGTAHNLALKPDGTVVAWGSGTAATVPTGLDDVVAISTGGSHNLALRRDGTVVAWGTDSSGQLNVPAGLNNVLAVAARNNHSLALKDDGTVVAWGRNDYGQTNVPTELSNVVAIAAGDFHSLALKADGSVVVWGADFYRQRDVPAQLTNVIAIAGGAYHSVAVVGDGRPFIATPALDRTVAAGGGLTLRTLAVGAALRYQWQFNGTNLDGATGAALVLQPASPLNAGTYRCIVSNALGTVTSREINIEVSPPTLRFETARPVTQMSDDGFHFRLTGLSGAGPVVIFVSTNLTHWDGILTNAPTLTPVDFLDADATNSARRYYRAMEVGSP